MAAASWASSFATAELASCAALTITAVCPPKSDGEVSIDSSPGASSLARTSRLSEPDIGSAKASA